MTPLDNLWYWIRERERIRVKKERGGPQPWTSDPILHKYRFCNVRREDDLVTRWVLTNIRVPFADDPNLWLMLCIARQINWPDTLNYLIQMKNWPDRRSFTPGSLGAGLDAFKSLGRKMYTGAYMISAPSTRGADKHVYIADVVIGELWQRRKEFSDWFTRRPTLQGTHALLTQSRGWGQFMAYQAVVDMRFTRLLRSASDVSTWAAAGPGTIRGLNRVHGRSVKAPLRQGQALEEMRAIYDQVAMKTKVAVDFSDVPNVLCEVDKYLRVKLGRGKPRALYVAGRGS